MKSANIVLAMIGLVSLVPVPTYARLGETPQQCDERYGEATFKNSNEDFAFRSYTFNGRTVHVTFYKAESRLEQITSGPHAIFGGKEAKSDQAANLFVEFMRFFRGLLSSAYHFTDEQMQGLAHGKQTDRQTVFHGPVTNDDFRGVCWMVMSRAEDSIEMFAAVSKPLDGNEWTRLTDFQQESQVLEYKSQEKERAKGF